MTDFIGDTTARKEQQRGGGFFEDITRKQFISVATLENELPHWKWAGFRCGLGWSYRGSLDDREVRIVARVSSYDDTTVRWCVYEKGCRTLDYVAWYVREAEVAMLREQGWTLQAGDKDYDGALSLLLGTERRGDG